MPRLISAVGLVVSNALPLWACYRGDLGAADLVVLLWWEGVVFAALAVVRIATATGPVPMTGGYLGQRGLGEFVVVHGGLLLALGVFVRHIATDEGLRASREQLAAYLLALALAQGLALVLTWFGTDRPMRTSVIEAATAPYPRLMVLWIGVIITGMLTAEFPPQPPLAPGWGATLAVAAICVLTLAFDLDELANDGRVATGTFFGLGVGARPAGTSHRRVVQE